jgi:hypothetical protein
MYNSFDINALNVGDEIAVDVSGRRAYRSSFYFGTVSRSTKQFIEVVVMRKNYESAEPTFVQETYKFSKATGGVMGLDKNSYTQPSLHSASKAREIMSNYAETDRQRNVHAETKAALLKCTEDLFGDSTADTLRALADSIEAERKLQGK